MFEIVHCIFFFFGGGMFSFANHINSISIKNLSAHKEVNILSP